jgi:hypothetical protein
VDRACGPGLAELFIAPPLTHICRNRSDIFQLQRRVYNWIQLVRIPLQLHLAWRACLYIRIRQKTKSGLQEKLQQFAKHYINRGKSTSTHKTRVFIGYF